jgi:hypothetical protein
MVRMSDPGDSAFRKLNTMILQSLRLLPLAMMLALAGGPSAAQTAGMKLLQNPRQGRGGGRDCGEREWPGEQACG